LKELRFESALSTAKGMMVFMKKAGNILFWVVISVLVLVILYNLYNRYKPNVDLKQVPSQETRQDQGSEKPDTNDRQESGDDSKQKPQKRMAPDFTVEDINGRKVKLSDYKGKIVILNFWATWCPYCVQEMPDLDELHAEFSKDGDAVILTVDVEESIEKVKKFVEDKKLTLPVLMDYDGKVAGMYGVNSFPTTYVINRDGTVYGYQPGAMTKTQLANVVERVKQEEGR